MPHQYSEDRPDAATLRRMYHVDRMPLRAIAKRFGVQHITVGRWMRRDGIERRPTGRGLAHYGRIEPSRGDLQRLVHREYCSYAQIAALYGVDSSAVMHWLVKHAIPRPTIWGTRRKGDDPTLPSADELRTLYESGLSTAAIGQICGVSDGPIRRLCREYNIPVRDSGWKGLTLCDDGHFVRSSYELRVDNWLSAHGIAHWYEPALPFDRRCHADFLANGWYVEIWGVTNSAIYRARRDRKRRLYAAHGLPLIEIGSHAFSLKRAGLWERQIAHCLTPSCLVQLSLPLQIPA